MYPNIRCYKCNKFEHYSDKCPEEDNNANGNSVNGNTDVTGANGYNAVQMGIQCEQGTGNFFKQTWVLLYSCSTDSCTNNPQFLHDIQDCDPMKEMMLHTNGAHIEFKQQDIFADTT